MPTRRERQPLERPESSRTKNKEKQGKRGNVELAAAQGAATRGVSLVAPAAACSGPFHDRFARFPATDKLFPTKESRPDAD